MAADRDEIAKARKRLALVLYNAGAYCGNCEYDGWGSCDDCREVVYRYVDALGLVPAGHGWCPIHGDALCPEEYMLNRGGPPWPDYARHWSEELRCGQRRPTFTVAALSGSTEGASDGR